MIFIFLWHAGFSRVRPKAGGQAFPFPGTRDTEGFFGYLAS
jgi:hypothetical protein